MLLTVYVVGWLITTVGALTVADWMCAGDRPPKRVLFGVVAGALWPLVTIGLVQLAATAIIAGPVRTGPIRHCGLASIQLKEVIAISSQ